MAGLGKTTLARRLYDDPYIVSYFYVRVWVTCSQDYKRRELFLGILRSGNPPESIYHLIELQTLIMSSRVNITVPDNMWKMKKLRHLCIKSGENLVNCPNVEEPSLLKNLRTMSMVSPTRQCQHLLARARNLLKLGLCGSLTTNSGDVKLED
ncbi:hypothetical protein POM88_048292 [Heracleum sosnowskyi]|uniref:NB-ARC domain-containing protein n=1 Tax=Heracleum sosnowskyi TaxID=360622 RepID=A0AAD8LZH9_9APIA|nr:hypothetical protein POM88_048291 [Heracleum sosnowskyi]KAK1355036.1 hypothetical protein POM88_048292 [Heracleum sosnowskyi]